MCDGSRSAIFEYVMTGEQVAVDMVVMGMQSAAEVTGNLLAAKQSGDVPVGIWGEAQRLGLLPPHLPVPH